MPHLPFGYRSMVWQLFHLSKSQEKTNSERRWKGHRPPRVTSILPTCPKLRKSWIFFVWLLVMDLRPIPESWHSSWANPIDTEIRNGYHIGQESCLKLSLKLRLEKQDGRQQRGGRNWGFSARRKDLAQWNSVLCGGFVPVVREMQILDCQDCGKL